jgi:isopenicillin-N epimerase
MERRRFLHGLGTAAGSLAWPVALHRLAYDLDALHAYQPPAPDAPLLDAVLAREEELWALVRSAFMIPEDRIFLNVATLGPQPRVVVDAVLEHTRRVAMSYPPAFDWDLLKEYAGAALNGDPAGFVFPRNTTEGMSFVANGLDLGAGDEVITTTHEHIGGVSCWELVAARHGLTLTRVTLPVPATSAAELVDVFRRAITPRTRVVSVSHVTFTNGTVMPISDIAALCRERGIICVVDGAHPPGMMPVDLRAIDVDFYASSPHKWLCAPQGTGLLYMHETWRTRLWPTLASGGWDDMSLGAHRFNHMGSIDESRLAGLLAALLFQRAIGGERIAGRVRALRRHLIDGLADVPRVRMMSPSGDELGAGMVAFTLAGRDALALQADLARAANVRTRVVSEYGYGWMRLSPHIYNRIDELDRVIELIAGSG